VIRILFAYLSNGIGNLLFHQEVKSVYSGFGLNSLNVVVVDNRYLQ